MPDRDPTTAPRAADPSMTDKDPIMTRTYPVPAIRLAGEGKGVEITTGGLRIVYDQLKLALDDKVAGLSGLAMYDHRCARADLRNLLDLIDALENRYGFR
jgi:hypothetical protein